MIGVRPYVLLATQAITSALTWSRTIDLEQPRTSHAAGNNNNMSRLHASSTYARPNHFMSWAPFIGTLWPTFVA